MKANFTIDEMAINQFISGTELWFEGEKHTVLYVKLEKLTRQVQYICVDPDDKNKTVSFWCPQDDEITWEVNNKLEVDTENVKRYIKDIFS